MLACKFCGCGDYIKNGHARGHQRYKCKSCGCQFTDTPNRGKPQKLKDIAVVLYAYCGISMLKIAKMCGVSDVAVLKWIRKSAQDTQPLNPKSDSGVVMLDEMWHFVNGKENKVWLWRAIDGQTRRPLAWVLGDRTSTTVKKLMDRVDDGTCIFVTDEYAPFFTQLPPDRHYYGKDLTFPIEQSNSDIRHWLARFIRKSKSSSRCIKMLAASITLMHHVQETNAFKNLITLLG